MTPEEIRALLEANRVVEAELENDLDQALAAIFIDGIFNKIAIIKAEFDADTITATKAQSDIETLLL
jgi:hypothetical protein